MATKSVSQMKKEREARLSKSSSVSVKRAIGSKSAGTSIKTEGPKSKSRVSETIRVGSTSRGTVTGTQPSSRKSSSISQPSRSSVRGQYGPEIPAQLLQQRREQQAIIDEAGREARSEFLAPTQDLGTTKSQAPAGRGPVMPANIRKDRERLAVEQEKEAERIRTEVAREKYGNFGEFKTGDLTQADLNPDAVVRAQARREKKVIEGELRGMTVGQKVSKPFTSASKYQKVLSLSAREARFKEGASGADKFAAGTAEFSTGVLSSFYDKPVTNVVIGAAVAFVPAIAVGRAVQVGLVSAGAAKTTGLIAGGLFTAYAGGKIAQSAIVAPKGQKIGVAAESAGKFLQFGVGAGLGSSAAKGILSRSTKFTDYRLSEVATTREVRVKAPRPSKVTTQRSIKSVVKGEGTLQGVKATTKGLTRIKTVGVGRESRITSLKGETTTTRGRFRIVEASKLKAGKQEVTIKQFRGKKLLSTKVETRDLPMLDGKSDLGKRVITSEVGTTGALPKSVVETTTKLKPTSRTVEALKGGLAVEKTVSTKGVIKSTDVIEFTKPAVKTQVDTLKLKSSKDVGLYGVKYNQKVRQVRLGKPTGKVLDTIIDVRSKPKARVLSGPFESKTGELSGFKAGKFKQTTSSVGVRVSEVVVKTRPQTFGEKVNVKFAKAFLSGKRGNVLLAGVDSAVRSRSEVFGPAGSGSSFKDIIGVGGKGGAGVGGGASSIKVPSAGVSPITPTIPAFAPSVSAEPKLSVSPVVRSSVKPDLAVESEVKSVVEPVAIVEPAVVVSPISEIQSDTVQESVSKSDVYAPSSLSSFSSFAPPVAGGGGFAGFPSFVSGFQESKAKKKRKKGKQLKLYSPSLVGLNKKSTKASRAVGKLTGISVRGGRI